MADLLKKTYYTDDKDAIIRKFFLNFTVQGEMQTSGKQIKQWSVVDYKLAEPFATFVKNHDSLSGRPSDFTLELNHVIATIRKYERFNNQLRDLLEMPEREKPEQVVVL
ncbi:MAG TPA: hypothetical protein VGF75_05805 [Candidatus Saccharimonadales bacterium]